MNRTVIENTTWKIKNSLLNAPIRPNLSPESFYKVFGESCLHTHINHRKPILSLLHSESKT